MNNTSIQKNTSPLKTSLKILKYIYTHYVLILAVVAMLPACTSSGTNSGSSPKISSKPSFIYNPSMGGRIGGVGIARPHIRGTSAQRDLAISRAIHEIASQKGTQVKSWQSIETSGTRDSATTHMDTISIQTTSGEVIQAVIQQIWHDPSSSELYVWMLTQ